MIICLFRGWLLSPVILWLHVICLYSLFEGAAGNIHAKLTLYVY